MPLSERHKAWYYGTLAIMAFAEGFVCKSRIRRLLVGATCGWHIFATYQHVRDLDLDNPPDLPYYLG